MKKKQHPFLRYLVLSLEIILLWLLQSTPKLLPELFGAKPFLLLAAALSFSVTVDVVPAIVLGAVCGVLADISAGGTVGFFAVAVTLACYGQARVVGTYFNRHALTCSVFSLGSTAVILLLYFLLFKAFAGAPDSGLLLTAHYLPRMLYTALTFFPLYFLNRLITDKL